MASTTKSLRVMERGARAKMAPPGAHLPQAA
jgi:hypothetical protein